MKKQGKNNILDFFMKLEEPEVPDGVRVMNPYKDPQTAKITAKFLKKYYSEDRRRIIVAGINPGRFGAGITGVTFTDPVALEKICGIANPWEKKTELSSLFVYEFIRHWGGPEKFYRDFLLSAVSPLGYTKDGLNYNYYDDAELLCAVEPFVLKTIKKQIEIAGRNDVVIVLGKGKNLKALERINNKYKLFGRLEALDHPRFIMQYRKKSINRYLEEYKTVFAKALGTK